MCEIIVFKQRAGTAPKYAPGAAPADGDAGRILFFTGVRYERIEDPSTSGGLAGGAGQTPSRGKRKRRARG